MFIYMYVYIKIYVDIYIYAYTNITNITYLFKRELNKKHHRTIQHTTIKVVEI